MFFDTVFACGMSEMNAPDGEKRASDVNSRCGASDRAVLFC
jgi:hypothetical protein